jgi:hypothetical protein
VWHETRPLDAAKAPLLLEKQRATEESESPAPGASTEELEFIVHHASGKNYQKSKLPKAQHYTRDLQYPRGSLVYGGDDEDDVLYCLPDNKKIHVCQEMADNIGYPKLELGLSAMMKDQLADSLAYNSLKVGTLWLVRKQIIFVVYFLFSMCSSFIFVGFNSEQGFKGPEKSRRWSCQLALGNLRSEVITLRNEGLEKDKIMFSLVDRLKTSEAQLKAQAEAHEVEVEGLKKKLVEMNEDFEVAKAKKEISEMETTRVQKNIEEIRDSKEKCYEISMDCSKRLKYSFAKVGAYSSEQRFIWGDPEGVIQWIGEEVEAFEEILSDRGDFCAFAVPEGLQQFWRKLAVNMLRLLPRQKPSSL